MGFSGSLVLKDLLFNMFNVVLLAILCELNGSLRESCKIMKKIATKFKGIN